MARWYTTRRSARRYRASGKVRRRNRLVVSRSSTTTPACWSDHNHSTTCEMLRRFKGRYSARALSCDPTPRATQVQRIPRRSTGRPPGVMYLAGMLHFSTRTVGGPRLQLPDMVVIQRGPILPPSSSRRSCPRPPRRQASRPAGAHLRMLPIAAQLARCVPEGALEGASTGRWGACW